MEIRHLATLIAIGEQGSFSAAARSLGTVQSNVSAHISRLERELGVSLVDRHSGRLTEEGRMVAERGRRIIHEMQDLEADVHSTDSEVEGEVRLGVLGTTGRWLMPRLLPALAREHPLVRVTIHEGGTSVLVPRLQAGEMSAAIVHFPVEADDLALEPLFSESLVLLVHGSHRFAGRESLTLGELADEPLLLPPRNNAMRRIVDRTAASRGLTLRAQAEIDGVRLLTSLAFDAFGPAIVPATAIPDWLRGNFSRIELPELPKRTVGWATRRRPPANKPTRAALAVTKAVIAKVGDRQPGVTPVVASTLT